MRLCFLGDAGSIHLQRWINYFTAAGHEVEVISFRDSQDVRVPVHLLAGGRSGRLAYIWGLFRIRGLIRKIRPDILHAHYATSFGLLGVLSGFHPFVVSAWGSDVLVAPNRSPLLRAVVRLVLGKANALTSDSIFMSQRMDELMDRPARPVLTVTMGVSRSWLSQIQERPRAAGQILSLRGHQEIYNIDVILRSAAEVVRAIPEAYFVIAGEGPETPKLKALTKELGIEQQVHFVGQIPHPKVQAYLEESIVSVSVPSSDATAVSLLETMACGAFPVVTDLPANREWVEDEINGLIVPAQDAKALAAALIRALQEEALRQEAAVINREKVTAKAIWEDNMAEVEQVYLELLKEYKP